MENTIISTLSHVRMGCCKCGQIDEIPLQEHLVLSEYSYFVKVLAKVHLLISKYVLMRSFCSINMISSSRMMVGVSDGRFDTNIYNGRVRSGLMAQP